MKKIFSVNIAAPLFVGLLLMLPLFISGASVGSMLLLPVVILTGYVAGELLLSVVGLNGFTLLISRAVVAIALGSLLVSLTVFVFPNNEAVQLWVCIALIVSALILLRKRVQFGFRISRRDVWAGMVAFALSIFISLGSEFVNLTLQEQAVLSTTSLSDQFFFTANVVTVRRGSIFNAVYETGSALNYQSLPFFIPAFWANVLELSSHQSLYGLAMLFYKLFAFLLFFELVASFVDEHERRKYWFISVIMLMLIVLAPLHPLYVIKGEVENFVFSGMGYLLPAGAPTYAFSIPLAMLTLFVFFNVNWRSRQELSKKLFFCIVLSLLAVCKIPIFFCVAVFISTVCIKRMVFDRERLITYLPYGSAAVVMVVLLSIVFYSNASVSQVSIKYGYLIDRFGSLLGISGSTPVDKTKIAIGILVVFLLWAGIRLVGLIFLFAQKSRLFFELLLGVTFVFFAAVVMSLILQIQYVDSAGRILRDGTFDVEQFVRSAFFFLTVVSAIGLANLMTKANVRKLVKPAFGGLFVIWAVLTLSARVALAVKPVYVKADRWYGENYRMLKTGKLNDGLILVNPFGIEGLLASSSDYGVYWCAQAQAEGCYNTTLKNSYRWEMYKQLVKSPTDTLLSELQREGVKYIISTPKDSMAIGQVFKKNPLKVRRVEGSAWIYEVL